MFRQKHRGFTIIELMVVIMVLAIIAAILFPVFAKARYGGHRHGSCQSNEKQLGMALQEYEQDYDGFFLCGTRKSVVDRESLAYSRMQRLGVGWGGQLYDYAKATSLFACPSDWKPDDPKSETVISYALNSNLALNHVKFVSLDAPSRTVVLFEVANAHADVTQWDESSSTGATEFSPVGDGTSLFLDDGMKTPSVIYATGGGGGRPYSSGAWPTARHIGGADYAFADGHVKWLEPNQVSTGDTAARPTNAQIPGQSGGAAGTANHAYIATFSTR